MSFMKAVRVEVGPRDMEQDSVFMARRGRGHKEKKSVKRDEFVATIHGVRNEAEANETGGGAVKGGFALVHYAPDRKVEDKLKTKFAGTCRCIPLEGGDEPGTCSLTGKPATRRAIFAKAYRV